MDAEKDLLLHQLKSRIYELEEDNANYKKNLSLARKYEFRITGALLLIIGTVISLIAYPSVHLFELGKRAGDGGHRGDIFGRHYDVS